MNLLSRNVFGVDLGTSTVKIYSYRKNRLMIEKDFIAIRNGTQVIAVGNDAFEMFEKNPPNVKIDRPMVNGTIADVDEVEMMLQILLHRTDKHVGRKPILYFSVPTNMSEIEKRAYYAICNNPSLQKPHVFLVDRPICDALSLGIPITRSPGSMILNIGAQITQMSVIAQGQVIISNSFPIGGQQLNDAIREEIRKKKNLLIGTRTARRMKAVLANLSPGASGDDARRVFGIDTLSGLLREEVITSDFVTETVRKEVEESGETIRTFLERIPPQIVPNILDEGIFLTGGTARIPGISRTLETIIGCRVNLASSYELSTVMGLEEIIKHRELEDWAYTIKDRK